MTTIVSDAGVQFADASGLTNSPPIGFKNLQASATGLSATVTVSADEVSMANTANFYITSRAVSLSINSATSGSNGLDTGTIAASTWYSVWVISNGATTAGLLSTSATAPTMPSGYTFKARVGWIRTDGTGNKYPLSFKQYGRQIQYVVAAGSNVTGVPILLSGSTGDPTTPTWTAVGVSTVVPSTAAQISLGLNGLAAVSAIVAPNNSYGGRTSTTNPPTMVHDATASITTCVSMVLESANIYAASSGTIQVWASGWTDNL